MSRQTTYTPEMHERICEIVREHGTLKSVLDTPGMPPKSTITDWLQRHQEFATDYAAAKQAYWLASGDDEVLDIADSGAETAAEVQHKRLRTDVRFRLMESHAARTYGKKTQTEITGKDGKDLVPQNLESIDERIRQLAEQNPGLLESLVKLQGS